MLIVILGLNLKYILRITYVLFFSIFLGGCLGMPKNVKPVTGFYLEKYLGTWYEIARLDHSFERGLEQVSATYSLRQDGGVRVLNKGFSVVENSWNEAEGKAYFVNNASEGYLRVSFFGPFYGSYVVFELEKENYQYAFVSGPDLSYLWLLSRTPELPESIINKFVAQSKTLGFDTNSLIMVKQQ
ncbi:MAG: apolipoprotein D and lipocalin family protein [Lentisphaeria bacterium]|jgi:apolipoprotein D and lipocalin family protein